MLKQLQQSIEEKHHSTNWDTALASFLVIWTFAAIGSLAAEYFQFSAVVQTAQLTTSTWSLSIVVGLVIGMAGTLIYLSGWMAAKRLPIPSNNPSIGAALPIVATTALSYSLFIVDELPSLTIAEFSRFTFAEVLPGLAFWLPPIIGACIGFWIRDRRGSLPAFTVPKVLTVALCLLLVSAGAVGTVSVEQTSDGMSDVEKRHAYSEYLDGNGGPELPFNATETEPTPLTESDFACSEPVKNGTTYYGDSAVNKFVPATEERATDRMSVQRYKFPNGTLIPNRGRLLVDVPANTTHLRTVVAPNVGDYYDPEDITERELGLMMATGYELPFSTEWSDSGAVAITFAFENGTNHRYYAGICSPNGVDS